MFFTEEDYRKIEKWLVSKGIMDTQFSPATTLDGNETIAIVQNGKNVNTTIDALVEKLFLLGVDDFLNITDKYNQPAISLIRAISLIPFRHRKIGQVITFLNEDNKWVIYQFQGSSLIQWNNTTQWVNVIGSAITGELVPDEEDLTGIKEGDKTVLKFKNKSYNTANFSGLGRVYLRKNITEDRNILTQQMINQENTRYILQYDYDLNGQTITIPANCVIEFEGGSISNGTLTGNNTKIKAGINQIFDYVQLSGTFNVNNSYPEWFGAVPNSSATNCTQAIQSALDTFKHVTLSAGFPYYVQPINGNDYILSIPEGVTLQGVRTDAIGLQNNYDLLVSGVTSPITVIKVNNSSTIKYISIRCQPDLQRTLQTGISNDGIVKEVNLDNVKISWAETGIFLKAYLSRVTRCSCMTCATGFKFDTDESISAEATSLTIERCFANDITASGYELNNIVYSTLLNCACDTAGKLTKAAPYKLDKCKTVSMISCGSEGNLRQIELSSCVACTIQSCSFVIDVRNITPPVDYTNLFTFITCREIMFSSNLFREYTGTSIPEGTKFISIAGVLSDRVAVIFDSFVITSATVPNYSDNISYTLDATSSDIIILNLRKTSGTFASRPVLGESNAGYTYWDSTLGVLLIWTGNSWVNEDGTSIDRVAIV